MNLFNIFKKKKKEQKPVQNQNPVVTYGSRDWGNSSRTIRGYSIPDPLAYSSGIDPYIDYSPTVHTSYDSTNDSSFSGFGGGDFGGGGSSSDYSSDSSSCDSTGDD